MIIQHDENESNLELVVIGKGFVAEKKQGDQF